jgi:iron complex transport system substrate-binding protein
MRICSFQPGATEIIYALGLQDQLYGVTAQCDYPVDARNKPVIVRSVFDGTNPSSGEISQIISGKLRQGLGLYITDQEALEAADPDLLLTQALCDV